jgi:hypothetical protein
MPIIDIQHIYIISYKLKIAFLNILSKGLSMFLLLIGVLLHF